MPRTRWVTGRKARRPKTNPVKWSGAEIDPSAFARKYLPRRKHTPETEKNFGFLNEEGVFVLGRSLNG